MGCGNAVLTTPLYTQTFGASPVSNATVVDDQLDLHIDLTPWDPDDALAVVLRDVQPMFTGLTFVAEAHGVSVSADDLFNSALLTNNCSTLLADALDGFDVDVDVDMVGPACQFLSDVSDLSLIHI